MGSACRPAEGGKRRDARSARAFPGLADEGTRPEGGRRRDARSPPARWCMRREARLPPRCESEPRRSATGSASTWYSEGTAGRRIDVRRSLDLREAVDGRSRRAHRTPQEARGREGHTEREAPPPLATTTPLLGLTETAQVLGCHRRTARSYLRRGLLPGRFLAGRWKIRREDLEAFIEAAARARNGLKPRT
jgi:excisionase family DNA binding protein